MSGGDDELALTQEVAYASLPRTERRELHRRVGEWVERTAGGREAESAELAGYHFERALARSSGCCAATRGRSGTRRRRSGSHTGAATRPPR